MAEIAKCGVCGEPMPPGEEMFKYHGYSGPCPKPPMPRPPSEIEQLRTAVNELLSLVRRAQERLCAYLHPDSGIDDRECMNTLLEMFDGPEQRRIESLARAALASATH